MERITKYNMLKYMPDEIETENEVNPARIFFKDTKNKNVAQKIFYLVTREFRAYDNFALDYAKKLSEKENKPFCTVFKIPEFEIENKNKFFKQEFEKTLKDFEKNKINFKVFSKKEEITDFFEKNSPCLIIKDFDPIEESFFEEKHFPTIEIDGHNILPARYVSDKQEYNAATLRRKIYFHIEEFLTEYPNPSPKSLEIIQDFIHEKLPFYAKDKNDPTKRVTSGFSKYLNFGFISSQRIALEVFKSDETAENKEVFFDEIITQKELSDNFCLYCKDYKTLKCVPDWAKTTLEKHKNDIRPYLYSFEELENAKTHDDLWNASQKQLLKEGKIEGYLRMYWAKMILQWTRSPQEALDFAIKLNDKYAFDAPSANGYTAILWSIGGLHDRAFIEKPVSGKIRSMTYNGAKSKFDVQKYIDSTD